MDHQLKVSFHDSQAQESHGTIGICKLLGKRVKEFEDGIFKLTDLDGITKGTGIRDKETAILLVRGDISCLTIQHDDIFLERKSTPLRNSMTQRFESLKLLAEDQNKRTPIEIVIVSQQIYTDQQPEEIEKCGKILESIRYVIRLIDNRLQPKFIAPNIVKRSQDNEERYLLFTPENMEITLFQTNQNPNKDRTFCSRREIKEIMDALRN